MYYFILYFASNFVGKILERHLQYPFFLPESGITEAGLRQTVAHSAYYPAFGF